VLPGPARLSASCAPLWFAVTLLALTSPAAAGSGDVVAIYSAEWAGLPAAEIRLEFDDDGAAYRDRIDIRTMGLAHLATRFRGSATAEGRLAASGAAEPTRYEAIYDLRKRRDSHISMRFARLDGALVAGRGQDDTSRKPLLAEAFRTDVLDPLTAVEAIRGALRAKGRAPGTGFTVPVYDGARRFDAVGHVLSREEQQGGTALRVALTLRPIAGFKGETSEDGDPDDAPRPVELQFSDDANLVPVALRVPIWYLPLVVRLEHLCMNGAAGCAPQQPDREAK
jgi:hypothetical protein